MEVATACQAHAGPKGRLDFASEIFIAAIQERAVSANSAAGPDGAGVRVDGASYTLEARTVPQVIAFYCKDHGADAGDIAPTLRSMGHDGSHANAGGQLAIAFDARQSDVIQYGDMTGPLDTDGHTMAIHQGWAVRRLTPRECERLQGFPDGYTDVPWRGKDHAPDGPRYKALGNSMAVNVMRWIGRRIQLVSAIINEKAA